MRSKKINLNFDQEIYWLVKGNETLYSCTLTCKQAKLANERLKKLGLESTFIPDKDISKSRSLIFKDDEDISKFDNKYLKNNEFCFASFTQKKILSHLSKLGENEISLIITKYEIGALIILLFCKNIKIYVITRNQKEKEIILFFLEKYNLGKNHLSFLMINDLLNLDNESISYIIDIQNINKIDVKEQFQYYRLLSKKGLYLVYFNNIKLNDFKNNDLKTNDYFLRLIKKHFSKFKKQNFFITETFKYNKSTTHKLEKYYFLEASKE